MAGLHAHDSVQHKKSLNAANSSTGVPESISSSSNESTSENSSYPVTVTDGLVFNSMDVPTDALIRTARRSAGSQKPAEPSSWAPSYDPL